MQLNTTHTSLAQSLTLTLLHLTAQVYETELGSRAKMEDTLGMLVSPGHLPDGIATMALDGLENGVTLSVAKRHWLQTTAAKLLPEDFLMYIGHFFNYRAVPESVRQARFAVARTFGF